MIPNFNYKHEKRKKNFCNPSDSGKLEAEIWLELRGEEYTNPITWEQTLKWSAGKAVEMQMLDVLKQNGLVDENYTQEGDSIKMEREGITISMRFDAILKDGVIKGQDAQMPNSGEIKINAGEVLEVKSINNKNAFDIQKYIEGNPRENYVMQVSMYMDCLGMDRGHLFASTIDGLHTFWFPVEKIGEGIYRAGNTTVDINAEYKRFAEIYRKFKAGEGPNFNEELYKIPIEEIDWNKVSKANVTEARMNRKCIGSENSWKILYSPFRDLILEKQGAKRGYTEEELAQILLATQGYSSKVKK